MKEQLAHPDSAASTAFLTSNVAKSGLAWLGVLLGKADFQWSDVAAFVAAIYTILLIVAWLWDRVIHPILVRLYPNTFSTPPRSRYGQSKTR